MCIDRIAHAVDTIPSAYIHKFLVLCWLRFSFRWSEYAKVTLLQQRRMHPKISRLIKPHHAQDASRCFLHSGLLCVQFLYKWARGWEISLHRAAVAHEFTRLQVFIGVQCNSRTVYTVHFVSQCRPSGCLDPVHSANFGHLQLFLPWPQVCSHMYLSIFVQCDYSVCWETCYWAALGTCPVSIHLTCISHSPACLTSQELGFGFGTFWSGNVHIGSVCGLKQCSPCGCFAPVSGSSSLWMCKHGSTWAISAPVVSVRSPDVVNKGICHAWFEGRMLQM